MYRPYLDYTVSEETRLIRIIKNPRSDRHYQVSMRTEGLIDVQMLDPYDDTVLAHMRLFGPDEAMMIAEQLISFSVEPAAIDSIAPPQWLTDVRERCQHLLSLQFRSFPSGYEQDEEDSEESIA